MKPVLINTGDKRMTKFEELKNKENGCIKRAIETTDENLKKFFYNAAEGFRIKMERMKIKEAGEKV